MSFGGSAVKSLEFIPDPSCKGEKGEFIVEGGWGEERKCSGTIDLVMKKAAKEAKLTVELRGFCQYIQKSGPANDVAVLGGGLSSQAHQSETKVLCKLEQVIFDAREAHETRTLNSEAKIFKFPFTIDLPTSNLPPSYDDGKCKVSYRLTARLQWSSMGKQVKEYDSVVKVVMPREARRKLLAGQRPVTVTNNEQMIDENASLRSSKEDFKYEITMQRRVVSPNDVIPCQVRLMDMPMDVRNRISRVTASLKCTRRYSSAKGGSTDVSTSATITELIGIGHPSDMVNAEWQRGMVLNAPAKLEPTLETPVLTVKYVVNFSIFTEMGGQKPLTAIEVPIVVVPPGEAVEVNPDAPPTLVAFEGNNSSSAGSVKEEFVAPSNASVQSSQIGRQILAQEAPGPGAQEGVMYRATTSYDGSLPDELRMREGDLITVKETYDDGWGMGKNMSTGNIGFVYLDYLNLVNLNENGRRPPPRAQSEHTSRNGYAPSQAGSVRPGAMQPNGYGLHHQQTVVAHQAYAPASPPLAAPQPVSASPYMSNHYQSSPNLGMQYPNVTHPQQQQMHPMGQHYGGSAYDISTSIPSVQPGAQYQQAQNYFNQPPMSPFGGSSTAGPPSPGVMSVRRQETVMSTSSGGSNEMGQAAGSGSTYVCISQFVPTRADQLPMELGDIIVVRKLLGDGWAWGSNAARQYSGLLPMSSVTPARSNSAGLNSAQYVQPKYPYGPNSPIARNNTVPASPPLGALPQLPPPFQNHPDEVPSDPAAWNDQKPPRTGTPDGHKRNPSTKSVKGGAYGQRAVHPGLKMSPPPEPYGNATAQLEATMAKLARLASMSGTDSVAVPANVSTAPDTPLPTPPVSKIASPAQTPSGEPVLETNEKGEPVLRKRDTRPPPYEENPPTSPTRSHSPNGDSSTTPANHLPSTLVPPVPTAPAPEAHPAPARRQGSLGGGNAPPTLPRAASSKPKPLIGVGGVLMYRVVYDFTPSLPDELEATKGDIILVREVYEDDWAMGKNLSRNKEGVFPLALTEVIEA
ncbi:hypothetical protein HK097_009877 [Rhizophlyctis rosea]|uniref:SH3 domain-containing protein n=1 Tax=Rhizophlyctis rosea TaxID=64517 RepID=A0AAD5SBI3_9FUNG|nr:hypothetical protein HK097_009877 [Rhizophlyctis rosea]